MALDPVTLAWTGVNSATLDLGAIQPSDYCGRGVTPGVVVVPSNFSGTSLALHVSYDGGTSFVEHKTDISVEAGKSSPISADDVIGIGDLLVKFVSNADESSSDDLIVVPVQV
jgi:hypothetical protein